MPIGYDYCWCMVTRTVVMKCLRQKCVVLTLGRAPPVHRMKYLSIQGHLKLKVVIRVQNTSASFFDEMEGADRTHRSFVLNAIQYSGGAQGLVTDRQDTWNV